MDAAAQARDEEIGKQWAKDNAWELAKEAYEENYEQAIEESTAEQLQSYYLKESVFLPSILFFMLNHCGVPFLRSR